MKIWGKSIHIYNDRPQVPQVVMDYLYCGNYGGKVFDHTQTSTDKIGTDTYIEEDWIVEDIKDFKIKYLIVEKLFGVLG